MLLLAAYGARRGERRALRAFGEFLVWQSDYAGCPFVLITERLNVAKQED